MESEYYEISHHPTCTYTAGADFLAVNTSIIFQPLDQEACASVQIVDDTLPNEVPEKFEVAFQTEEGVNVTKKQTTVTIIDDDIGELGIHLLWIYMLTSKRMTYRCCYIQVGLALYQLFRVPHFLDYCYYQGSFSLFLLSFLAVRNTSICQVTDSLAIFPFDSNDFYAFAGSCDHYLLRPCTEGISDISVTVDFLTKDLSSGRVGLRYGDSSIISTETGEVIVENLNFLRVDGGADVYENGFFVYRETGLNRIEFHRTGIIAFLHTYRGPNRLIQVTITDDVSFSATDDASTRACGLCGNSDGTLLQADLVTVTNIKDQLQVMQFVEGYTVEASEQYLRGQRRECGKSSMIYVPNSRDYL